MKLVSLSAMLLLFSFLSFGQSDKYQKGMEKYLAALDSSKTSEDLQNVAAAFERIGDAEKNQWLPYYYAALAVERKGFNDPGVDKDQVAGQAETLINKAEAIDPKNAELYILKNMAATLHMMVNPMERWQTYGGQASEALSIAKKINAENPRIYLIEGQTLLKMPPQLGGGKDKARLVFEKSVALFKTFTPASALSPAWGQKQAELYLDAASK